MLMSVAALSSYGQKYYNQTPKSSNGSSLDFLPASPTAASLGVFGQVPVGNYTGTAIINIPFYTVNYKELSVPIGIKYESLGNKPDHFPGVVGLGWALQAGGSITRVIKGQPDYEKFAVDEFTPAGYDAIVSDDWNTRASLENYLETGGFKTDYDHTNPDEFYFNINGITGNFYMNHLDKFSVKSSLNTLYTVEGTVETSKTFTVPELTQSEDLHDLWQDNLEQAYEPEVGIAEMLYKILITDDHGIVYTFGGTNNAIEFSRPGDDRTVSDLNEIANLVTPITWHLTSIESPNGYKITFDYEQNTEVTKVGYCDFPQILWYNNGSQNDEQSRIEPQRIFLGEKSTLINACYLSAINTPKETITFYNSLASDQLQFPKDTGIYTIAKNANAFIMYRDVGFALTENLRTKKLDAIQIKGGDQSLYKTINLFYTNDTNTRLKLLNVNIGGNDGKFGAGYEFRYNQIPLPPYLSYKTDYYGFYNGRNEYITTEDETHYQAMDQTAFFNSKAPDINYVQAEILDRIFYPTGGYTAFDYEPNDYGTSVSTWPFETNSATANTTTGGVRIRQITHYLSNGDVASLKSYHYVKDYIHGGTISSGVLAYQPAYYDEYQNKPLTPPARYPTYASYTGSISFWKYFSTNPMYPLAETRGNHVTYSEVTEENEDGSAIVYKYKNYDNGYNDQEPKSAEGDNAWVSDNTDVKDFWKAEEGISMDLERGQPLSEEYYEAKDNNDKFLKTKTEYKYNDGQSDPSNYDNYVRVLIQSWNPLKRAIIPSLRFLATKIYTYFPYLKQVVNTNYEPDQATNQTIVDYVYDKEYRLLKKQETTTSDNRVVTQLNTYSVDLATTSPYDAMKSKGIVGALVSSEQQSDGQTITTNTTVFDNNLSPGTGLILPKLVKTKYKTNAEETRMNFNQYDKYGDLVCSSPQDGIKTCYVWSYNYSYPVAKIVNTDYATLIDVLSGQQAVDDFAAGWPTSDAVNNFLQVLRTDSRMSNAFVTSYTYNGLQGVSSETNPNNRSTYYEYDFMGRLSIVRDHNNNILKQICYNYAGQAENCGATLPYNETEFLYSTSATEICNTSAILQYVVGYYRKDDPESGTVSIAKQYYSDQLFTTALPDGYYRHVNSTNAYYHIVGGKFTGILSICP